MAGRHNLADDADVAVNDHEGTVLSVISRRQPLTTYQLRKEFMQLPTTSYNSSKGALYRLIARIADRGLIATEQGTDRRSSEMLRLTPLGQKALAAWVLRTGPEHSIANDPLLLRLGSLGDVSPAERVQWIAAAKKSLLFKKQEINDYYAVADVPYRDIAHGAALAIVDAKLEWLDRLLIAVVDESGAETRP